MRVTVSWSPAPRQVREWNLDLPEGVTVAQALEASGLPQECPDWERQGLSFSVWGRAQPADHRLRDQDRVEVLRPLPASPPQ